MNDQHRARAFLFAPQGRNWLERILYALVGATILVLAFFFLTVALVAGALLATVIVVRWWWLARKLRQSANQGTFEGEYTIVNQATPSTQQSTQNRPAPREQ